MTRNTELYANEEEAASLLKGVETELQSRRHGDAVRLEVEQGCPAEIRAMLLENLGLTERRLVRHQRPGQSHSPHGRGGGGSFAGPARTAFGRAAAGRPCAKKRISFGAFASGDMLLHHPYENFGSVVDFLKQAAADPNVLAIKQTLYRTGGDAQIVGALMEAVQNGKQVAAVVELKAPNEEAHGVLLAAPPGGGGRACCLWAGGLQNSRAKCAWWCARMTTPSAAICI